MSSNSIENMVKLLPDCLSAIINEYLQHEWKIVMYKSIEEFNLNSMHEPIYNYPRFVLCTNRRINKLWHKKSGLVFHSANRMEIIGVCGDDGMSIKDIGVYEKMICKFFNLKIYHHLIKNPYALTLLKQKRAHLNQ